MGDTTFHHLRPAGALPSRVVLLGAHGFLAGALGRRLTREGIPWVAWSSRDLDLCQAGAGERLAASLHAEDAVVMTSALTPEHGRDLGVFRRNLDMVVPLAHALSRVPCSHLVYLSSDAVYPFGEDTIDEESCAEPGDLYGLMHRTREAMLGAAVSTPLAVLRCTMIHGAGDTHDAYGPNRFCRTALSPGRIDLFGDGEETRDFVSLEDFEAIVLAVLQRQSRGVLNVVSGESISFRALADVIASKLPGQVVIGRQPRKQAITHRRFDASLRAAAFPDLPFGTLDTGIERLLAAQKTTT